MTIEPFTSRDFRVFNIPDFAARMAGIQGHIRPKLERLGVALASPLGGVAGTELYPHVAKHARRTVNPPDDTWVAFAPERRGYKKARHFKIAVSRHCLRFLFEIGPEFAAKPAFARSWKREAPHLAPALRRGRDLGWFKNEHDEDPVALLADLSDEGFERLGDELMRTREGQLVLGRRIAAGQAAAWQHSQYTKAALDTFSALGNCFRLR